MSGMFGSRPQPMPVPVAAAPTVVPEVKPPAPMPDANAPAAIEARRRAQTDIMGRAGRTSTILTAPGQRGDSNYTATKLGSAA